MPTEKRLFFIHAQTSLHPGTGTSVGTVDMPVQREKHTGWPMIAGSSLKGVLRDHFRSQGANVKEEEKRLELVFGSDPKAIEALAGALSITDARILAFPVRSAKGVFAWVTCPAVLERFQRDLKLIVGAEMSIQGPLPPDLAAGKAVRTSDKLVIQNDRECSIVLEEYDYEVTNNSQWQGTFINLVKWIAERGLDESTAARFNEHAVLIPDDEFGHYVQRATEVVARIGLNSETKTVKDGALFYEEFLPPETLMYSVLIANDTRDKQGFMKAEKVIDWVKNQIEHEPLLQIGGNETIGKGYSSVRLT